MEFAFDAQLAATDNGRRCERRVGELVRHRQEEGTIRPQFRTSGPKRLRHDVPVASEGHCCIEPHHPTQGIR